MSRLADGILSLHGWAALLVVFALPALEASAFVGFIFPGEIAVLLGGVLAFEHRAPLPAVIAVAIAGAVVGDTVGYFIGRRWGRQLLRGTVGRLVKEEHLDRAEQYLARRGGRAVFIGRFTTALRVLIPGLAGMARVDYATFAVWNVAGGVIWATGFVLLGYLAGTSWRRVEHAARDAGLVLAVGVAVAVVIVLAARWAAHHQERLRAFGRRQLERPRVAKVRERYSRQIGFLVGRVRPSGALGLSLTLSLVALASIGWVLGVLTRDVISGREGSGFDRPILDWLVSNRRPGLTSFMRVVTELGSVGLLLPVAVGVGLLWWRRSGSWRPLAMLAGALAGSIALTYLVKETVARPRPPLALAVAHFDGLAFPSGHATQATAVWGMIAALLAAGSPSWSRKVAAWASAALIALAVGGTRAYLGAHWASDVMGGWALGALWLSALLLTVRVVDAWRQGPGPERAERDARQPVA
jgi:membrane protein DedA with SNARE-associated domain/membrane-associated phospholipid phosphatase